MILFIVVVISYTTLKKIHFNAPILAWLILVGVLFDLMVDFEVLSLMVPIVKNNIPNEL
jgi:hypothetical protein